MPFIRSNASVERGGDMPNDNPKAWADVAAAAAEGPERVSQREIQTETLPGAWNLSGRARRAYAERISLDFLAEI
jgi:hypothetical protein